MMAAVRFRHPCPVGLRTDLAWLDGVVRAKRPQRVPVVLTREEVRAILDRLHRVERLMVSLLYGVNDH